MTYAVTTCFGFYNILYRQYKYGELILRGAKYPNWYPADPYIYLDSENAELVASITWQKDDEAKQLRNRYDVKSWVAVNQVVSISLTDWLLLSEDWQRAIAQEVEEVIGERNRVAREREMRLDQMMLQARTKDPLAGLNESSISKLFR